MALYTYDGPVMEFERCVADRWQASTYAPTERKARSNLTFRYKKENNKTPNAKISLPGRIVTVEEGGVLDG